MESFDNVRVYVCLETRRCAFWIPSSYYPIINHSSRFFSCVEVCAVAEAIPFTAPRGKQESKGSPAVMDILFFFFSRVIV